MKRTDRDRPRFETALGLLLGLCAMALLLPACEKPVSEDQRIALAFEAYKTAVLGGDGPAAAAHLDQSSVEYYAKLLQDVRRAEADSVRELPPSAKLQVLHYRALLDGKNIEDWDGTDLFAFGIESGLVDRDGLRAMELGEIRRTGDQASADVHGDGRVRKNAYTFFREGSEWRIDLVARLDEADAALRGRAEESKISVDELILQFLEMSLGKAPPETIWRPLTGSQARG